jgi:sporulation protein YlmC with PRC-barrel domain
MVTDDSLHGRVVLSGDGVNVGEVMHLIVDPQNFRISAFEVRLHKDVADRVHLAHGILRGPSIHIPTESVQSVGDAIILALPLAELRELGPDA